MGLLSPPAFWDDWVYDKSMSFYRIVVFHLAMMSLVFSGASAYALKSGAPKRLEPNTSVEGVLLKLSEDNYRQVYSVQVTNEFVQVEFKVTETTWNFDIYLSKTSNLQDLSEAEFAQANRDKTEELVLNRFWGEGKLETGIWYLYLVADPPNDLRLRDRLPSYKLTFRVVPITHNSITQGIQQGKLDFENGSSQFYYIDIPRDVETYTVAITGCEMDTDILMRRNQPALSRKEADILAETYLAQEMIVLRKQEIGQSLEGRWYIVVTQKPLRDHLEQYQLYVGPGADVPASFKTIPNPLQPPTNDPLTRAAYSVVEILHEDGGGSGCLVSSNGLIITNHHVITDLARKPLREVAIGISYDLDRPTRELFWAEVLWTNEESDLAILQIRRGLYNQTLPSQLRFPFLAFDKESEPKLGSNVWALGYPYWGGRGTKTSITLSRGIISGFEKTRQGRVFKIDAAINHGSSGGAVLNEQLQLIGIATSVIFDQSGQLGFAHPIKMIPQNWLERMGR